MNFRYGHNIVLFDGRLKAGSKESDPTCKPPKAWTVIQARKLTLPKIISIAKNALNQAKIVKADNLYILCHGAPAYLQLGADSVSFDNIDVFKDLKDKVSRVEIYACSPAQQDFYNWEENAANNVSYVKFLYNWQLFQQMANNVNASVKVAKTIQQYTANPKTLEIDFGKWEGPTLDIYPNGVVTENENNS